MTGTKRKSLKETLRGITETDVTFAPQHPPQSETREAPISRKGKGSISGYVNSEAKTQYAILALEVGKKQEALLIEAVNDLFRKYNKSPLA